MVSRGISTVAVVNAVNAAQQEAKLVKTEAKLGDGKSKDKGAVYEANETIKNKWQSAMNVPLLFDVWHSAQQKAEAIATMSQGTIPRVFEDWLNSKGFKAKKEEQEQEPVKA